ncbi:HAMP domain-containing histidine kinase [Paraburkholderia sp. MMS20-SJTR3]|uniref:histidine kinase n=1 Tax=Paraburkholderia sejongensis TaxID=2886946 RepID=A0ABS8JSK0_9BURK|nr:HAMP domain-containing sensor histidine kinase [Paraburkholderia sp. MMS20-SJTR3]MCC8392838.1 HAMP domain-containing histidine kinase [Paraburkholderia sp. MMS20-SJTR3]
MLLSAALLLGCVTYGVTHEALEQQLDHRVDVETTTLIHRYQDGGAAAVTRAIDQRENEDWHRAAGMWYGLFDAAGRRIAGSLDVVSLEIGRQEHLQVRGSNEIARTDLQALTTRLSDQLTLVVAAERTPIAMIDRTLGRMVAGVLGAMTLVGIAGAWMIGLVIRRRLERINDTAEAIINGDFSSRVANASNASEFDRLALTINRMLDRNAELMENLQQVSSDLAHDLRTPMARMQQRLESALLEASDIADYRSAIESAAENGRDALELFSALLRISEIETQQVRSAFRMVDLSALVERVVDAFRPDIEMAQHELRLEIESGIHILADRHLLSQLLANLIENGIRHTPAGTELTVSLIQYRGRPRLLMSDNGPGIAPDDRAKVLRRFVRLEQSRSTPGYGLGLALVAAIARAHHATLVLEDNCPGLLVSLTFEVGN